MQSIHCKVSSRGSIRRFALTEAKFSALRQHVAAVFGLVNSDIWTLKYKDDEGMMVTISSDEELAFAVQLLGNPLHLIVDEPTAAASYPPSEDALLNLYHKEDKMDKKEKKDKKGKDKKDKRCKKDKKKEKKEKRHGDKDFDVSRLAKKQEKIRKRLDDLKDSDQLKRKEKLQAKLTVITAKLESAEDIQNGNSMELVEVAPQLPLSLALPDAAQAVAAAPAFDQAHFKEVSKAFYGLRRDFLSEQKKMRAMAEVAKAVKVLSRHGNIAQSPLQVGTEHAKLAKDSMVAQRQLVLLKKEQLKKQAELFKMVHKQRKAYLKGVEKKKHCKGDDKVKCREKRLEKIQEKRMRLEEKAVKKVEKAKRKEEKAQKHLKKAAKEAEKAKKREEKLRQVREERERAPEPFVADACN
jgi:hypothetical protein